LHHLGDGEQSFVAKAVITIFRLTPAAELDAYFEGIIPKDERDIRVRDAEEIKIYERLLLQSGEAAERPSGLELDRVLALVEPFAHWAFLGRDDKRKLLGLLCPSIRVCRHIIKDLQLLLDKQDGGGYKGSHSKTAALVTTSHNLLIPINF